MANEKLKAARLQKRWSQAFAAQKVGVSVLTYSRWENGTQTPYLATLDQLCNAFGMSPEDLGFEHVGGLDLVQVVPAPNSSTLPAIAPSGEVPVAIDTTLALPSGGVPLFPGDSAIWFGEKIAQIHALVALWSTRAIFCAELEKIAYLELKMPDEIDISLDKLDEFRLSRRNALIALASLPLGVFTSAHYQNVPPPLEDLLPACAASIAASWHLMAGREIAAVERAVLRYLPVLNSYAKQSSLHQQAAAYLAAQGDILMGLVSLHKMDFQARVAYCKQAVEHARISEDRSLQVIALTHLGGSLVDVGRLGSMVQAYEEATLYHDGVLPAMQSKALWELAYAYACNGQAEEALSSISKARDIFPGETSDIPVYATSDTTHSSMLFFEVKTRLALWERYPDRNHAQQAWNVCTEIDQSSTSSSVPERIRIEIINRQALTALRMGDRELFCDYWIQGANGAKALKSEKRRQEIVTTYKEARLKWPDESQVKELADLLL